MSCVCVYDSFIDQTTPTLRHWMYCLLCADDAIHPVLLGGSGLVNETACVHMQACACVYVCVSKWLGELAQDLLFSFNLPTVRYTIWPYLTAVSSVTLIGNAQICNRPPP